MCKFLETVSAFVDSEVTPLEHLALQEHLKNCPHCKNELVSHYMIKDMIGSSEPRLRDINITSSVMSKISGCKAAQRRRTSSSRLIAAAVVFAALMAAFLTYQTRRSNSYDDYAHYIYTHVYDTEQSENQQYMQASLR